MTIEFTQPRQGLSGMFEPEVVCADDRRVAKARHEARVAAQKILQYFGLIYGE